MLWFLPLGLWQTQLRLQEREGPAREPPHPTQTVTLNSHMAHNLHSLAVTK